MISNSSGVPALNSGQRRAEQHRETGAEQELCPSSAAETSRGTGCVIAANSAVYEACCDGIDVAFEAMSVARARVRDATVADAGQTELQQITWKGLRDLVGPLIATSGIDLTDAQAKSMLATIKLHRVHPVLTKVWPPERHAQSLGCAARSSAGSAIHELNSQQVDEATNYGYVPEHWPNRTVNYVGGGKKTWNVGEHVGICRLNPDGKDAKIIRVSWFDEETGMVKNSPGDVSKEQIPDLKDPDDYMYDVESTKTGQVHPGVRKLDLQNLFEIHENEPFDVSREELKHFLTTAPRVEDWIESEQSRLQMEDGAEEKLEGRPSAADADNFYKLLDMTGHGGVTPSDWRYCLNDLHMRPSDRQILSLAAFIDESGTGLVSKDDFREKLRVAPWIWRDEDKSKERRTLLRRLLEQEKELQDEEETECAFHDFNGIEMKSETIPQIKGKLTVTVLKANDLTVEDDSAWGQHIPLPFVTLSHDDELLHASDPAVNQEHLGRFLSTKPSHGRDPTWCPQKNKFEFSLHRSDSIANRNDDIEERYKVYFHVWNHHSFGSERYLGQAELDLNRHLWWTVPKEEIGGEAGRRGGCLSEWKQPKDGAVSVLACPL
eukprot:SAG31_NODE_235_length_19695_cov_37.959790_13_plen_606_part_00